MRELYPDIDPYAVHRLAVGPPHEIHVEECGNRNGIPVLFLHGGPGSGCNENHRRYFNPEKYRIVISDQRGCNRSTPRGCVEHNSTDRLLADIEAIRTRLGIERWLVFGGSWGATLGLLYAETFPGRVLGLVLRGVFLARQRDLDWFARDGAGRVFPDYWEEFAGAVPPEERNDLVAAYHRRVHGPDPEARRAAALAWSRWAGRVVAWTLPPMTGTAEADPDRTLCEVSIETHYAVHRYFLEEDQLLRDSGRIPRVPVRIIHGRRDLTCTLEASWTLSRALPDADLNIVGEGGHLAGEPVMVDALVSATDAFAERLA
jgi:proline iminopeptidase